MLDVLGRTLKKGDRVAFAVARGGQVRLQVGRLISWSPDDRALIQLEHDTLRGKRDCTTMTSEPLVLVG